MRRIFTSADSIIEGIRASDHSVLNYLYKEYYPLIKSLVLTNGGGEDDVSEILQEGIITFYEKAVDPDFELTCNVKTFLYAICRNKWLKNLRNETRNSTFTEVHENTFIIEDNSLDEEQFNDQQKVIAKVLDQIGEGCKKLLTLFYYEKKTMSHISEVLGYTNAANAKNQKYKCLKRLQKLAVNEYNQMQLG